MDYVAFAEDVDPNPGANASNVPSFSGPLHITESLARAGGGSSRPLGTTQSTGTEDQLNRLKAKVYRDRIRCQEFFRDFDKLRAGVVTIPQFRIALSMSGLRLNEAEFQGLVQMFRSSEGNSRSIMVFVPQLSLVMFCLLIVTDPKMMKWMEFVDEIEKVFVQKGLEKAPHSTVPGRPDELLSTSTQPLPAVEEDHALDLLARLQVCFELSKKSIPLHAQH